MAFRGVDDHRRIDAVGRGKCLRKNLYGPVCREVWICEASYIKLQNRGGDGNSALRSSHPVEVERAAVCARSPNRPIGPAAIKEELSVTSFCRHPGER